MQIPVQSQNMVGKTIYFNKYILQSYLPIGKTYCSMNSCKFDGNTLECQISVEMASL